MARTLGGSEALELDDDEGVCEPVQDHVAVEAVLER